MTYVLRYELACAELGGQVEGTQHVQRVACKEAGSLRLPIGLLRMASLCDYLSCMACSEGASNQSQKPMPWLPGMRG